MFRLKIKYIVSILFIWIILLYAGVDKKGTTSERPSSPTVGYLYYNTTDSTLQLWDGSNWRNIENLDSINSVISDSIATWADTTAMKTSSNIKKGYLKSFSSWYEYADSAYPEGSFQFGAVISGKAWILQSYRQMKAITSTEAGLQLNDDTKDTANRQRIQKVINDLSSAGGGTFKFVGDKNDTVYVDSTIALKNKVVLEGNNLVWIKVSDAGAIDDELFHYVGSSTSQTSDNNESVILRNLNIHQNATNNPPSTPGTTNDQCSPVKIDSAGYAEVSGCVIMDNAYHILLRYCFTAKAMNNIITDSYGGIEIQLCESGRIEGNRIDNRGYDATTVAAVNAGAGFTTRTCANSWIVNNENYMSAVDVDGTDQAGIIVGAYTSTTAQNAIVSGNYIDCADHDDNFGFTNWVPGVLNNLVLSNNTVKGAGTVGCYEINQNTSVNMRFSVTGNIALSSDVPGFAINAGSADGTIAGNVVDSCSRGFSFGSAIVTGVTISGNKIGSIGASATGCSSCGDAFYFNNTIRNVNIIGNTIDSCRIVARLYATDGETSENIIIANNVVDTCGWFLSPSIASTGVYNNLKIVGNTFPVQLSGAQSNVPTGGRLEILNNSPGMFINMAEPTYLRFDENAILDSTLIITRKNYLSIGTSSTNYQVNLGDGTDTYFMRVSSDALRWYNDNAPTEIVVLDSTGRFAPDFFDLGNTAPGTPQAGDSYWKQGAAAAPDTLLIYINSKWQKFVGTVNNP